MKHIDDGTLHAYLDGAVDAMDLPGGVEAIERHLAACAACAARLTAERRVRDRANALLSSAAPAVHAPPPFGAVVARRAPSGAHPHRAQRVGWRRLAVAASVVLALGVGWTARDLGRRQSGTDGKIVSATHEAGRVEQSDGRIAAAPASAPSTPTARAADVSPESGPPARSGTPRSASQGAPDRPAGATGTRVRQEAEPVPGAGTSRVDPPVDRPVARIASADAAPPPAPPPPRGLRVRAESAPASAAPTSGRESPVLGEPAGSAARTADAMIRLRGASTSRTPTLAGRVTDDAGRPVAGAQVVVAGIPAGTLSGQDGSYVIPLPAGAAHADEPLVVTASVLGMTADTQMVSAARDDLRHDFVLKPAAIELSSIVVTGVSSEAGAGWIPVGRAEAEGALGRPLVAIADLPFTRIAVSATRDEVLVTQSLGDGREVRLLERVDPRAPPAAAPVDASTEGAAADGDRWLEVDASPGEGVSRMTLAGKGLLIEAEAPVALHQLRKLLLRLR